MRTIKYLVIQFKNEIGFQELRKFRGAVVEAAGREHVLFHNHEEDKFRYSYPLIQYKRIDGKAALVCLEEGIHEVHAFFQGKAQVLNLDGRVITPAVERLTMREITMSVGDDKHAYRISNWLALNQEHYREWQRMPNESESRRFLMTILRGNLLSMAKGLGWRIDREVIVDLHHIGLSRPTRFKEQTLASFDAGFYSNIRLPQHLGLGKGAALGYGMVGPDKQAAPPTRAIAAEEQSEMPGETGV
ncbi:MAG: hypothetical protein HUU34_03565 [Saprospiraceae bacterium]|jgi:hypothetical protein|nr:hypothetical protein [Saprospiraceae bacterium]